MTTDIQSAGRHQRADTAAPEQPMAEQQYPLDMFPDHGYQGRHSDLSADVLGVPEAARRFIELGGAVIAEALLEPPDSTARSVAATLEKFGVSVGDGTAAVAMAEMSHDVPKEWQLLVMTSLAIENKWVASGDLLGGAVHRRIDAVYDMFETDYCAHEVQAVYLSYVEQMRDAAKSAVMHAGEFAGAFAGGFAGGWFGFGGALGRKASEWIDGALSKPNALTFQLAEIALGWAMLSDEDGGLAPAQREEIRRRCRENAREASQAFAKAKSGTGSVSEATAAWNMWKAICDFLAEDNAEGSDQDLVLVPSFVEYPLNAVRHEAGALGLQLDVCDGIRPSGDERTPLVESNWKVIGQYPLTESRVERGGVVVVVVAKFSDAEPREKSLATKVAFSKYNRPPNGTADPSNTGLQVNPKKALQRAGGGEQ